ncbi:hypothetical protein J3R82DRAFT_10849 [Butyriboletus roseoflavus]|nr:hypothetical protein J3R82DRAFT_10849 [Butyriboletus roseoflavus]
MSVPFESVASHENALGLLDVPTNDPPPPYPSPERRSRAPGTSRRQRASAHISTQSTLSSPDSGDAISPPLHPYFFPASGGPSEVTPLLRPALNRHRANSHASTVVSSSSFTQTVLSFCQDSESDSDVDIFEALRSEHLNDVGQSRNASHGRPGRWSLHKRAWARYFHPMGRKAYHAAVFHLMVLNFPYALIAWLYLFVFTLTGTTLLITLPLGALLCFLDLLGARAFARGELALQTKFHGPLAYPPPYPPRPIFQRVRAPELPAAENGASGVQYETSFYKNAYAMFTDATTYQALFYFLVIKPSITLCMSIALVALVPVSLGIWQANVAVEGLYHQVTYTLTVMDALKSLVQPLVGGAGGSSVIDGVKLVVLGGTVETARRVSSSAWSHFINSFFLTAHFSEEDYPYDWLMLWLSRRPEWQRSREFETTTRTTTPGFSGTQTADNSFGDEDEDGDEEFAPWKGVTGLGVVARSNAILKQLVLQAKKEYEAEAIHRIQIYFADSHGSWRWTDSRHKRPMSSIVLNPGVKEMLLNDARDFLKSEKWYADRGIPFRRGYLLHGVPGSGKSSLIHAIAGELMLDIYTLSLSSSWISDSTLTTLMGRVPARCIVLLEDLDAAFTRSVTRDKSSNGTPDSGNSNGEEATVPEQPSTSSGRHRRHKDHISDVNTLSLSGLLNALDGVAAAEGRILFATTNHLERLDPALSRPGRMDVWIEFKNSSKWQAEALFRNFFPSTDKDDEPIEGDLEGIELPSTPAPRSPSFHSSTLWSMSPSFSSSTSSLASSTRNSQSPPESIAGSEAFGAKNQAYLPPPVEEHIAACQHSAKPLDGDTLAQLAKKFADSIPDDEFSVAALQGYLLRNKSQPETAAEGAAAWVVSEREMRERLKKEKEAREFKEKLEREKRRKELIEKEKEKAELEKKELELTKLRQQLQEQESKSKADSDKKEDESSSVPTVEVPKDEDKSESTTDEDSDEESVPPPSTPPETAWITVTERSS